jgi:hypothetical protein
MINPEIKITGSVLQVKAVGDAQDVSGDFDCIPTKSIAELLDGKQKEEENNTNDEEKTED